MAAEVLEDPVDDSAGLGQTPPVRGVAPQPVDDLEKAGKPGLADR
jgi:hypothetical protein